MQGLWIAVATIDHPSAYDPATGPVVGEGAADNGIRFPIGTVVDSKEWDVPPVYDDNGNLVTPGVRCTHTSPPWSRSGGPGDHMFRWLFIADADQSYMNEFAPADADTFKKNIRLLAHDTRPIVMNKASFESDVRDYDKRTFADKLLGRR